VLALVGEWLCVRGGGGGGEAHRSVSRGGGLSRVCDGGVAGATREVGWAREALWVYQEMARGEARGASGI
jgi:hypothetical protein